MTILYFIDNTVPCAYAVSAENGERVPEHDMDLTEYYKKYPPRNSNEKTHKCDRCRYHLPQIDMYKWSYKSDGATPVCKRCWNELMGLDPDFGLTKPSRHFYL